jgi:two-component system, response regulator
MITPSTAPSSAVEILLVEDNPHDAELTLRALRQHQLTNQVVWAKNGAEALDLIFGDSDDPTLPISHSPRLILLDLNMPKIDGHEVLHRLKSDPRTRRIPVVVLTSSQEEADLARAYENGGNSYIVKPVDFDRFVEAVRQMGFYWLLLNQAPAGPPPPPSSHS